MSLSIRGACILCLLTGPLLHAADVNGGRPDLLPRKARWRTFSSDVRKVTVDPRGRPWFEIEGQVSLPALKKQTALACQLTAPWIQGAAILHIDRQGRVWLRPHNNARLLLGYNPKTDGWIERDVVPEADRKGHDEKRPDSGYVCFLEAVHESKSGTLYFADRLGVHVLSDGKWTYKHLYEINLERSIYHDTNRSFDAPRFAEEDGRVFVWTRWGHYGWSGTVGFFTHDGKTWSHHLLEPLPPLKKPVPGAAPQPAAPQPPSKEEKASPNRLHDVIPLTDQRVMVCPDTGDAFVTSIKRDRVAEKMLQQVQKDITLLGDDAFAVREAAHDRLARLGGAILPQLQARLKNATDPEVLRRLTDLIEKAETAGTSPRIDGHVLGWVFAFGKDRHDRTWVWADHCRTPDGQETRSELRLITRDGKVLSAPAGTRDWFPDSMFVSRKGVVYLARYEKGCQAFDGDKVLSVTDSTQTDLRYVLGEDRDGRIYLSNERRVHAYDASAPEERASLPTTIYEVPRGENDVVLDSRGRLWATRVPDGQDTPAVLAVFEKGAWRETTVQGQMLFLMPLEDGCLLAQDQSRRQGYFYDGDAWHTYPSLKELIEKRHQQLVKLIDNNRWGRDFYVKIRVDDAGRIWLIEWMKGAVWDGKRWIDLVPALNAVSPRKQFDMFYFLIPHPDGKRMLATSGLSEITYEVWIEDDKVKVEKADLPRGARLSSDYTTRSGMWMDGQGRVWLPQGGDRCTMIDRKGTHDMPDTGFPRFVDSRGCVWLHKPYKHQLVVLDPKGRRATLTDEALNISAAHFAEDASGTVWVGTERGILTLRRNMDEKVITLQRGKLYEKNVPRGTGLLMRTDREGNLWFYGPGPKTNYRLYQVKLP